jgi:hypothetical protein
MIFSDAELLTYTSQNNFLSDGEFRYGSTKIISIDSIVDTRSSNTDQSGVRESQEEIMKLISGAYSFEKTIINGYDFGYGRIRSINYGASNAFDSNQVRIGRNTFEIEISDSGDNNLYNMTGDHFVGLKEKFSKHHLLEDFNEGFTFTNAEDGSYSYTHTVDAKYFSGAEVTDPIEEAKNLAEGIFEQDPSFGFLNSQRSGFYSREGKKYYSESYDLRSNNCSFTKNFECKPNLGGKNIYTSDFSSDSDGWTATRGNASSPHTIGGKTSTLKFVADTSDDSHKLKRESLPSVSAGKKYKITGKIYIPSTCPNVKGFSLWAGNDSVLLLDKILPTLDSWHSFSAEYIAPSVQPDTIKFWMTTNDHSSWAETYEFAGDAGGGDFFSIIDIVVTQMDDEQYCSDFKHSLSSDENGIITVAESAEIMGLDDGGNDELYNSALNGLDYEIINSYNRCSEVLSGYSGFYGGDNTDGAILDDLNRDYVSLQKNLNKISSNLTYEVTYNNNSNVSGNLGQHSFTLALEAGTDGIRSIVEQGQVSSLLQRGNVNPITLYNSFSIDENSPYRCGKLYSGAVNNTRNEYNYFQQKRFNLIASDISYQVEGKNVSYSKQYTDDPSVIKANNISKLDISSSDVFEVEIHNNYFIPNQQKEILQKRGITSLSSRTISANCIYQKPSTNFWTDSRYAPIGPESNTDFFNALKFVKNKMLEKAFDDEWITIDEIESMFISDFSYNTTSEQGLSVTMNITYESK